MPPRLLALSDLHVAFPENRKIVEGLRPESDGDWLLLAGDVGELSPDIEWALRTLSERFATVVWAPGNHELWTHREDPVRLRGEERYLFLVDLCRGLGILTPEDPYPVWQGPGGPVTIAPLFLLYDYTFLPDGALTKAQGLARAYETGIVCSDEALLHPDPYPSREAWCWARVEATERRLAARDPALPGRLRQPLSPGPRADPGAALPAVRPVVRNDAHARLARALQRRRGRLRPPAHTQGDLARRRPVRGGVDRLPARVAAPRHASRRAAADPPGARRRGGRNAAAMIGDILPSEVAVAEEFGDVSTSRCFPPRKRSSPAPWTSGAGSSPPPAPAPGPLWPSSACRRCPSCPACAAPRSGRPAWSGASRTAPATGLPPWPATMTCRHDRRGRRAARHAA